MSRQRKKPHELACLELFAGGGGFAMAAAAAGFKSSALIERDTLACQTLTRNFEFNKDHQAHVIQADAKALNPYQFADHNYDLLLGGPPCQPFSVGGNGLGHEDSRDMIPTFADFVRKLHPRSFLIENVVGLTRPKFADYLKSTLTLLSCPRKAGRPPEIDISNGKVTALNGRSNLAYRIHFRVLNAADFGVPQMRHRLFIVGVRQDQNFDWQWPDPTHSRDALLHAQFITKCYFARHDVRAQKFQFSIQQLRNRLEKSIATKLLPHRTVRDTIADLPDPRDVESQEFKQHLFVAGARAYHGHTGSPCKTKQ